MSRSAPGAGHAVVAGLVCALVGFTSSFAVVITGLRAVGASPEQASSGLLVLCVTMGLGSVLFSWRLRMPMTLAWSTPGAALLATAAVPAGGFGAAVVAFAVTGVLLAACGLVRPLGRLVEAIPLPVANAMLAGVLLTLCTVPFRSLADSPGTVAPVVALWLILTVLAPRWAVPGALVAALVVMAVRGSYSAVDAAAAAPHLESVSPVWDAGALIAIAIPLFLVTMTSQNIPGMAVLASFGYRPPLRDTLLYTGAASAVGAVGGGHAINLAAISAALAAGPQAHPDPARRWVAGVACGTTYLVLAPLSALVAEVATAAPAGLIAAIAGLALLGTLAGAVAQAFEAPEHRLPAAVALAVAASGMTIAGVGPAFWSLVGGLVVLAALRAAHARSAG
ncbi:benzoate/H(+) symporter BenE family transporter [Nocardioides sp. W7]|uniref:benzoate/H(+) symporter BenE family transporter n=1 Tax=Nocardioides sp. W7 TaxID=2931390 RepID=UPI001FD23615|nr:benzoate/H(+) symporter BenE family transporter [Nocardioides sp. W7]